MDASSREKLESRESLAAKKPETKESPAASRDVKTKASEVLRSDTAEGKDGAEDAEMGSGKVSEGLGEDKAHAAQTGGKAQRSDDEIEAIRAKLLAAIPPQAVMIKQIKNKLLKEERVLTKRMGKLRKRSHREAWQLTIVVAKLRKIREYFSTLAHATYEMVKHLWLKIVHGV